MDLYLVEIPKSIGREQSGFRPAVLISNPTKEISIIIPFTSNILGLRFPFTMQIEPTIENGLTSRSILLLFQMRAIDSSRLKKKIGIIDSENLIHIKKLLHKMLNL